MYALIERFGDTVSDLFEQMEKSGGWKDDLGHDVRMNVAMMALAERLNEAIDLRAKATGDAT